MFARHSPEGDPPSKIKYLRGSRIFDIVSGMEETVIMAENKGFPAISPDPELEAMLKAAVHMGHAKTKDHPSMKEHIFGVRNTISIIDLAHTKIALARAMDFLKDTVGRGGLVLLVGTRPAARAIIHEVASKTNMSYFTERWIGGTLTNFKVIGKRVEYMEQLEREKASGELEKYTKKERMGKEEELVRLKRFFDGLRPLKRLPSAVFIVDITHDDTAAREARRMKIPVAALTDTNSNAGAADYAIPSNDDALPAVRYMVERIGEAIEEGLKIAAEKKAEEKQAE